MRRLTATLVLLGLIGVGLGAQPTRAERRRTLYGPTDVSCGTWTTHADTRAYLANWLRGFVSGAGFGYSGQLAESDNDAMTAWVTNYCTEHPLDLFTTAAKALVNELMRRAGKP